MNERIPMEGLLEAKENADRLYGEWIKRYKEESDVWSELGYGTPVAKLSLHHITELVKGNWGKITAISAAFGVPLAAADVGAFTGVLGKLASLWPF